jgi:ADP-ribose pyrophosphatase YjhB (NUDIX family)
MEGQGGSVVQRLETVGISVYALRRSGFVTEVLLLGREDAGGAERWQPVSGAVASDESELAAAVRGLADGTGLSPERFYATGIYAETAADATAPGRVGVFVAFVPEGARVEPASPHDRHVWLPLERAGERLGEAGEREALGAVRERFVKRPPDESLRVL